MSTDYRRIRISVSWSAFALCAMLMLSSYSATAQDKFDVKGGHFNKDEVNKDFFAHPSSAPALEAAPEAPPAKPADSWEVDDSSFKGTKQQQLQRAVQDAQKQATEPASPFTADPSQQNIPADLTHAAQAIEQLKTMLKTQGNSPNPNIKLPTSENRTAGTTAMQSDGNPLPSPLAPFGKANVERGPEPATLSVIVSAIPETHFIQTMKQVADLKRAGAIKIGSISILGLDDVYNAAAQEEEETISPPVSDADQKKLLELQKRIEANHFDDPNMFQDSLPPKPPTLKLLEDLKLAPSGVLPLGPMFTKYQATSSPIWIVKDVGKDHVFEGAYNPSTFFDSSGKFIAADRGNPREENNVAVHQAIPGVKFRRSTSSSDDKFAETALSFHFSDGPPKDAKREAPTPKHEGGKFTLPFLPNCERSGSSKTTVAQQMMNGGFDLVFYSANDQGQISASQNWDGKSVAYNGGQAVEYKDPDARWQMLALTARIRCLPTRFHFFEENSQRYLEYREGETAWVK